MGPWGRGAVGPGSRGAVVSVSALENQHRVPIDTAGRRR